MIKLTRAALETYDFNLRANVYAAFDDVYLNPIWIQALKPFTGFLVDEEKTMTTVVMVYGEEIEVLEDPETVARMIDEA